MSKSLVNIISNLSPKVKYKYDIKLEKNVIVGFEFGGIISVDIRSLKTDLIYRSFILVMIFDRKYYFEPGHFKFNQRKKTLHSSIRRIGIKMEFDPIKIDQRYLFWLISVLELYELKIIEDEKFVDKQIEIVCEILKLKAKWERIQRFAIYRRFIRGEEVERRVLILTSEKFSSEIGKFKFKGKLKFTESGFKMDTS